MNNDIVSSVRKIILGIYHPTNAKEFEILGRAIVGCEYLCIRDNKILNTYHTYQNRPYINADWRAVELIDRALKEIAE